MTDYVICHGRKIAIKTLDTGIHPRPRKPRADPFVKVPLAWARLACRRIRNPTALILLELLYATWRAKSSTVTLTAARAGVHRYTLLRALHRLETAGVIEVVRSPGKAARVTLLDLSKNLN